MKAASLILLCGILLTMGLPVLQAEQRRDEALWVGRWGGSSHRRSLQQATAAAIFMMENQELIAMESENDKPPPRDLPDERGEDAKYEPKGDTLPPSYHGPTTKSASGALAASDGLTTGFPKDGISCAIPATSASQKPYDSNRPYKHTFPGGYTLLFIPYYSAEYTGYHWTVYDNHNKFYSFDDGDASPGEYDYDGSEDLPAGCQYVYWQPSDRVNSSNTNLSALGPSLAASAANVSVFLSAPAPAPNTAVGAATAPVQTPAPGEYAGKGAHTRAILSSYAAPAPAPGRSPRTATLEAAKQNALLSAMGYGREGLVKMLCKPIAAKRDPPSHMSKAVKLGLGLGLGIPAALFLILVCVAACLDPQKASH